MSVDDKIVEAVRNATEYARQPEAVADRLLAWFEGLSGGSENLEDPDSVERYLETLFQATVIQGYIDEGNQG